MVIISWRGSKLEKIKDKIMKIGFKIGSNQFKKEKVGKVGKVGFWGLIGKSSKVG